jgi:hypothetical protein
MIYCEVGRDDDARALLKQDAANNFAGFAYDVSWLTSMTNYARVSAHLLARRLAPFHNQLECNGLTVNGSVAFYLGLLATVLDRGEDADAHFAEAHAMHERIGARYWLAVTRVAWASALLQRGGRDRTRAMLEQALATAREHGFGGVERRAERLQLQLREP